MPIGKFWFYTIPASTIKR